MGRFLGSFMDDNELDRPDLNKCPDCECYFPQDNCPICGKECPEEMRAGNRKIQKKKKKRNGRSNTVQFVDWYHRWWFIILMLIIFPILGIILLASSPHKKSLKITVIVIAVVYSVVSFYGAGNIFGAFKMYFDKPVDDSISFEEYVGKCEEISIEDYFRNPNSYKNDFIKAELTVTGQFTSYQYIYNKSVYNDYYICSYQNDTGVKFDILVRDCVVSGIENLTVGDKVTVYGECEGSIEVNDAEYNMRSGVCINGAYFELVN